MLDWEIEKKYYSEGAGLICGCDEAGRGPLAGPVFAAAVILPVGLVIEGLDDSKRIKPEKREELYNIIRENALDFAVAHAEVYEIEAINILNASMLAMRRAIAGLRKTPDLALIDGNIVRDFNIRAVPVVKGERDRFCEEMDKFYPGYNFTKNKGYATKQHKAAILKNGPAPVHRRSFLRKTLGDAIEQFDIWQSW